MKKVFVLLAIILCTTQIFAQTVITGNVIDSDGEPLPGVNILVKGVSGVGTITNMDGFYTLEIPKEATYLIFSFTGMKSKEIEITGNVLNVTMESQDQLVGDVVITALGISKQTKKLGYAIDNVDGDAMLKSRQGNPINALNGRIAGANIVNSSGDVGASSSIVLRGYTSLAVGENQPLFIVDGIPYDNTTSKVERRGYDLGNSVDYGNAISDINPDDIESVSVLKGASASALYGSRAQNGVILITTKNGKASKGLNISYTYDIGMNTPLRLPDFQNEYGQGYLDDDPSSDTYGEYYYTMSADESWGPKLDVGLMIVQPWMGDEPQPWVSHPDNIKNFLKTGISQNHNLSIQFGGDKTSGRISYTGARETGMLENTEHKKDNFALNLSTSLNDKISVSTNIKYSITNTPNSNGTAYGGSGARNVFNNAIWSGRQVDFSHPNLRNYWLDEGNRIQRNWNTSFWNNPYFQLYENLNIMKRNRFNGLIKVDFQITKELSAFIRLGTDRYTRTKEERFAMGSRYDEDGSMWKQTYLFQESNADFLISYNKNFSEKINFTASVGGNLMDQASNNKEVTTTAFVIPDLYSTAATAGSDAQSFFTYDTKRQIRSLYGILDIEVPFGINLGFNYRQDWSSTLPVNNNSYGYFSTNLAWVATDAIELPSIVDLFKVRINYSEVGADTDPYQLITPFVQSTTEIWTIPGYSLSTTLKNGNLKPMRTKSFETGFDVKLLQKKNWARIYLLYSKDN
ncbi:MAG: SusC/RagA family TonB-linked outer membrane protein [Chloroflexia bacterium]|nr:SusC/RagA family TonB-linked outer membrane protein [Chloroflexia bacterium]